MARTTGPEFNDSTDLINKATNRNIYLIGRANCYTFSGELTDFLKALDFSRNTLFILKKAAFMNVEPNEQPLKKTEQIFTIKGT